MKGGALFFDKGSTGSVSFTQFQNNTAKQGNVFNAEFGFQKAYGVPSELGGMGGAVNIVESKVDFRCLF